MEIQSDGFGNGFQNHVNDFSIPAGCKLMDFAGPNPHTRLIQVLIEIQIEVLSSIEVLIGGKDFLVFRGSHAASMQIGPALSFPRKWGCQEALESQSRRRRARYKLSCL